MPDIPDFTLKPSFPIASVIDAAQRNNALQEQSRQSGQQQLLEGLKSIGQLGQSLVDRRRSIAQSLALGRQFDIPDEQSKLMEPDQVLHAATIKQGQGSVAQYMMMLHPDLANNHAFMAAIGGSRGANPPAAPGATLTSDPVSPEPSTPGMMLTGGTSTPTDNSQPQPSAQPTPGATPAPAVPGASPFSQPVNKGTLNMLKLGMQSKPEAVLQYVPGQGLVPVGTKHKGDQVITTQPGSADLHASNEQDRLEQNAINRIATIRGDPSIGRIEAQRDAATMAFNTIQQAKNDKRDITQTEYYDTLGQLWKARTGASPTDQSVKDLDINTVQAALNKKLTWVDGKPRGATTPEIINALQKFVDDSGRQADKLHEGYMQPRLIKPYGLSADRWKAIQDSGRGLSYQDATKDSRQAGQAATAPPSWTPEKEQRRQLLLQKQQAGSLQS